MKAAFKKTPSCEFLSTILLRPRHMAGEFLSLIFCMLEHRLKSWNATVGRDSSPCHTPKIECLHNTTTEEHRHPLPHQKDVDMVATRIHGLYQFMVMAAPNSIYLSAWRVWLRRITADATSRCGGMLYQRTMSRTVFKHEYGRQLRCW